jgi:hypothetical protein
MLLAPDSQGAMQEELKGKRKHLKKGFENNPNEIHLALELKIIDDQIAARNQQVQLKSSSSISSVVLAQRKLS